MATWPAYDTVANADLYHASHGNPSAWSGASTAAKETALRMATEWLDQTFGPIWVGIRADIDQARDWPRIGSDMRDDVPLDETTVPQTVKDACAYMALRFVENGNLMPDLEPGGTILRERTKVGELEEEIEYQGGKGREKTYLVVRRMLLGRGLIGSGAEVYRA